MEQHKQKQDDNPLLPPSMDEWWKMCLQCQRTIAKIDERTKNLWRLMIAWIAASAAILIALLAHA